MAIKLKIKGEVFETKIKKPSQEVLNGVFSLFSVSDYKGGELSSKINTSYSNVAFDIIEYALYDIEFDNDEPSAKEIFDTINKILNYPTSEYAGSGDFCGEAYYISQNKLQYVSLSVFEYGQLENIVEAIMNDCGIIDIEIIEE